jgi:hypothetical protein
MVCAFGLTKRGRRNGQLALLQCAAVHGPDNREIPLALRSMGRPIRAFIHKKALLPNALFHKGVASYFVLIVFVPIPNLAQLNRAFSP